MKHVRRWVLVCILATLYAAPAAAIPVIFSLDSVTIVGAAFPVTQTYVPGLPIVGSGTLFEPTKVLTLPSYSIILDVSNDLVLDAQIDITGWTQTISAINIAGFITSTGSGSSSCTVLGGIGGLVCPSVSPTIGGWSGGNPALAPSAKLTGNALGGTIVVTDATNATAGTVTQYFSYTPVPEPGTGLLLAGGLIGVGIARRRGRH
jgi:hypothetical protein